MLSDPSVTILMYFVLPVWFLVLMRNRLPQRQQQIRRLLHRPPHHQHTLRRRTPRGTVGAQLGTRLAGQYGADLAGTGIMDNPAVTTTAPPSMTPNISRR